MSEIYQRNAKLQFSADVWIGRTCGLRWNSKILFVENTLAPNGILKTSFTFQESSLTEFTCCFIYFNIFNIFVLEKDSPLQNFVFFWNLVLKYCAKILPAIRYKIYNFILWTNFKVFEISVLRKDLLFFITKHLVHYTKARNSNLRKHWPRHYLCVSLNFKRFCLCKICVVSNFTTSILLKSLF